MNLSDYQKYNSQFCEKFIYRLGGWTGFFSEYNNMVIAIFYCIINHKRFVLQSRNANFSSGQGWTEFFEPFCEEIYDEVLNTYNLRVKRAIKGLKKSISRMLYSKIYHPDYHYTYEFFDKMRDMSIDEEYFIPELNLHGNLRKCCSEIHQMIWHYNEKTGAEIKRIIMDLHLPAEYCGMHIRQGDKILEANVYPVEHYMEILLNHTDCKDVFVLTDDYRVIQNLKTEYSKYNFYTLCQATETGYDYDKLMRRSYEEQKQAFLRLWASMDVLERGKIFVGTFSANPGMNMGFRMAKNQLFGLDFEKWQLW